MQHLEGKVALITGAGRRGGIGAAVARRLAGAGAQVVVSDLCAAPMSGVASPGGGQWEELQTLAEEIAGLGVRALALRGDVTARAEVESMVAETLRAFGRLDILVNNAGVALGPAPVAQMQEAAWRRTLDINATGVFLCCQAAIPALIRSSKSGRIVNMSSLAAIRPKPYLAAYAASKAAVIALTQSLAQEVAPFGITVNAILPGDIDTAFKQWGLQIESLVRSRPYEQVYAEAVAQIPVGRMGLPEDVASLVAYLASPEASFITGQAYPLTGGRELVAASLPA
ncbi:MAG: SDR family oxidoreductase [Caldilineales bacterium]|nr:SDR family oxidoreductase [Caldilineales bacterium]MCW5856894.1 SDR family oxidoreductase [Caldilineales bacterium]